MIAPDSYGEVALGQDNSGEAAVFPDSQYADPMRIWQQNQARQDLTDYNKYQQKKERDLQLQKDIEGLGNPYDKGAFPEDIKGHILPAYNELVNAYSDAAKNGENPNSPLSPSFAKIHALKEAFAATTDKAIQHSKAYNDMVGNLQKLDPTQYDIPTKIQELQKFRSTPFDQRTTAQLTPIQQNVDLNKIISDRLDSMKKTSESFSTVKGDYNYSGSTEYHKPEQWKEAADSIFLNPATRQKAMSDFDALPKEEKNNWIKQNGADAAYAYTLDRVKTMDSRKTTSDKSLSQEGQKNLELKFGGMGAKDREQKANDFWQQLAGLKLGNPAMHVSPKTPNGNPSLDQEGNPLTISEAFQGLPVGTYNEKNDKGEIKESNNLIKQWKRNPNTGQLYIKDTRAENDASNPSAAADQKKGWRPIKNLWTDFAVPYIRANYGKDAELMISTMQKVAKAKGVNLQGGTLTDEDLSKFWKPAYGGTFEKIETTPEGKTKL